MAISVTSQLDHRSNKALEVRAQYATVADMKAMDNADLNPGLVAYCEETKKKYEYHPENPVDPTTGKWKELKTISKETFDTLATKAEVATAKGEAIQAAETAGDARYVKKSDEKQVVVESQGLTHTIKYGGQVVGTINIPKDMLVQSFEYVADTKKLRITVNSADGQSTPKVTEVSVADFVNTYEAGTGLSLTGSAFSLSTEMQNKIAKIDTLETKVTALEAKPHYELGHQGGDGKAPVKQEANKLYVDMPAVTTYEKATAQADGLMSKEHYKKLEGIRGFIHAVNPDDYEAKRQAGKLFDNSIYFLDNSIVAGTTPESFKA